MSIKTPRILIWIPIGFWFLIIVAELIRIIPQTYGAGRLMFIKETFLNTALSFITFSVFYYYVIPNIFKNKLKVFSILMGLLSWIFVGFIWIEAYHYLNEAYDAKVLAEGRMKTFKYSLSYSFLSSIYAFLIRFAVDWVKKSRQQKDLERQTNIIKAALLRSQINPHFLFNTLNNISAFCLRSPEKASGATKKLTEIMNYMLNEANSEKIPLNKEIEHIQNFVELQKLRFKEKNFIKFTVEGDVENWSISPMVFLPFVENAFKHGSVNKENSILISINAKHNELNFKCFNSKKKLTATEKLQKNGIGLVNIKERLELLYPNKYSLQTIDQENQYSVKLKIT